MAKILLVEDDLLIGEAVIDSLNVANHTVDWVRNGREGLDRLLLYEYELAILDWVVPEMDGVDLCRAYRSRNGLIPILMLTGKSNLSEKLHGFEAGADDYLTKPFDVDELLVRVRALLRRPASINQDVLTIGDLCVDPRRGKVMRAQREISLQAKELAVLEFLIRHKNQFFTVAEVLNHVWSSESDSTEEAVRQCIMRLRRKIDVEGEKSLIVTSRGLGYKFEAED